MINGYLVTVQNDWNEEMTFRFDELHDALTLYRSAKHDDSVTLITVDGIECDDNEPDVFVGSENIRYYEKGVDYVCDKN